MPDASSVAPNAEQIESWNTGVGQRWAELQDVIDAMFAPLTDTLLKAAEVRAGGRVLDVGCGCGATVLRLAERTGPTGSVQGVDVSEVMLARARQRTKGLAAVRLTRADASTLVFTADFDLVFSRFGVMFFDDPVAGFMNLRTALAPGGRFVAAVWRSMAENAWASVPWAAALPHLPRQMPSVPGAPGPFAFADPDHLRAVLTRAGFSAIALHPYNPPIPLAGSGQAALAAERATSIGVVARALSETDAATRAAVKAALTADFAKLEQAQGIVLGGAIWLITARR